MRVHLKGRVPGPVPSQMAAAAGVGRKKARCPELHGPRARRESQGCGPATQVHWQDSFFILIVVKALIFFMVPLIVSC